MSAPTTDSTLKLPWWVAGDTNAFFGLGFNILVNVLTLTGLMIGVVKIPAGDVLGTVLPALGVALILGNLFAASAPTIGTLVLARFLSGIPHGAFIGVAMLIASSLTLPTKQARAVSNVQLGITVATIVGVPAFTLLGHVAGWRLCFVLMSAIAAACSADTTTRTRPAPLRSIRRPAQGAAIRPGSSSAVSSVGTA